MDQERNAVTYAIHPSIEIEIGFITIISTETKRGLIMDNGNKHLNYKKLLLKIIFNELAD